MPSLKKNNPVKSLLGGGKKNEAENKTASNADGTNANSKDNKQKNKHNNDKKVGAVNTNAPEKNTRNTNKNERTDNQSSNVHQSRKGFEKRGGRHDNSSVQTTNETSVKGVSTRNVEKNTHINSEPTSSEHRNRRGKNDRRFAKNSQRHENSEVRQLEKQGEKIAEQASEPVLTHEKNSGKNRDKSRRDNQSRRNKGAKTENIRAAAVEVAVSSQQTSQDSDSSPSREMPAGKERRRIKDRREASSGSHTVKENSVKNIAKQSGEEFSGDVGRIESGIMSASPLSMGLSRRESSVFGSGSVGLFGDKNSNKAASTEKAPENEPVYVDKNRPLAEQIMEDMEKRRGPVKPVSVTDTEEKTEIVGVRFRNSGKIYYFAPGNVKVEAGENVIVETARGVEYGFVAIGNTFVKNSRIVSPLKTVVRKATAQDTETYNLHRVFEKMSEHFFRYQVEKLGLEMALVYVEYTFDASKIIFYFTADGRVDFRELIKELAAGYKTRIELRQIGVRDEAKLIGGLGICGRPICCNSFLSEFSQVSIKMAKDQNLFLNSSKISGTCGRFMCCLKFEDESYRKEYEMTPKAGDEVITPQGKGKVMESNAIKGILTVLLDDKNDELPVEFTRDQVEFVNPPKFETVAAEPDKQPKGKNSKKSDVSENANKELAFDLDNQVSEEANKANDVKEEKQNADKAENDKKENNVAYTAEQGSVAEQAQSETNIVTVEGINVEAGVGQKETTQEIHEDKAQPVNAYKPTENSSEMAVSENNIVVIEDDFGVETKLSTVTHEVQSAEPVTKETTPQKTEGIAFADGIVTVDDSEVQIEKAILERNTSATQQSADDDFVISTESGSKNQAFADGVITIES